MTYEKGAFLEHFGVKGMKWGVRKQRDTSAERSPPKIKKKLTPEQIDRRINLAIGIASAAIVIGGVIQKEHQIKAQRNTLNRLGRIDFGESAIRQAMGGVGNVKARDVRTPPKAKKIMGEMSPETKKFIADFTSKQNTLIRDANAGLRLNDNDLQIPFQAREYLKEWT